MISIKLIGFAARARAGQFHSDRLIGRWHGQRPPVTAAAGAASAAQLDFPSFRGDYYSSIWISSEWAAK
jgi:hypothetical protein